MLGSAPQLYYFYRVALDVSGSIEDQDNGINRKLVWCLLLSWIVVCACVIKGVKSSVKGKVFEQVHLFQMLFRIEYIKKLLSQKETELYWISWISPYFE